MAGGGRAHPPPAAAAGKFDATPCSER